jgi:hypothetical protein
MRLLRAKEQMVEQVIRDRDLAKEKYISSLEHQLKTKDDMLSQVIFSITQLSTRSQSAAPIRHQSLEIEDSRVEQPPNINVQRYQEEIKEEQLNLPKINYKRNEVFSKAPSLKPKEVEARPTQAAEEEVGFFRGGNKS